VNDHHAFPFLREILLFLILAGILIPTLQRLRINQARWLSTRRGCHSSPSPPAPASRCWLKSACCS
jgi:hypothetical protein